MSNLNSKSSSFALATALTAALSPATAQADNLVDWGYAQVPEAPEECVMSLHLSESGASNQVFWEETSPNNYERIEQFNSESLCCPFLEGSPSVAFRLNPADSLQTATVRTWSERLAASMYAMKGFEATSYHADLPSCKTERVIDHGGGGGNNVVDPSGGCTGCGDDRDVDVDRFGTLMDMDAMPYEDQNGQIQLAVFDATPFKPSMG